LHPYPGDASNALQNVNAQIRFCDLRDPRIAFMPERTARNIPRATLPRLTPQLSA